jgi:uncharacterized protein YndB with AHSA1/START domain
MATTTRDIPIAPRQVWEIFADGKRYAEWVVGAKRVREVESHWPEVGAKFHHTVGVWPLYISDSTAVLECDEGSRLVLEARIRPLGRARIELILRPSAIGTEVVMIESPTSPIPVRLAAPLFEPLIHTRNTEALRRLASVLDASS